MLDGHSSGSFLYAMLTKWDSSLHGDPMHHIRPAECIGGCFEKIMACLIQIKLEKYVFPNTF